ncbi:MAG: S-layer homology domain-containing protein, partial [Armatimonadota bacterium]
MLSPAGPSSMRLLLLLAAAAVLTISGAAALGQPSVSDIRGHWAEARINDLLGRAVISLGAERAFRPNESISRAQFVAWLVA